MFGCRICHCPRSTPGEIFEMGTESFGESPPLQGKSLTLRGHVADKDGNFLGSWALGRPHLGTPRLLTGCSRGFHR